MVADMAAWLMRWFIAPGHAVELRVIYQDGSVDAGFFDIDHLDAMAEQGLRFSQSFGVKGVYFTLNPLDPAVVNRPGFSNHVRRAGKGTSASKADVTRRRWLLIDADPRRPPNCSATDAEKAKAAAKVPRSATI